MNNKVKITKYLIDNIKLNSPNEKNFKSWLHIIWQNPRLKDKGGLRLTPRGFELFSKSDIKYFEIKSEKDNFIEDNKFILWLDNHFCSPFFITRNKIYVFDEHTAVQLVLFSGNIRKYYNAHLNFLKKQNVN